MGKGSTERSRSISYEEYTRRWEAVFGKEEVEEEQEEKSCPCGGNDCCE